MDTQDRRSTALRLVLDPWVALLLLTTAFLLAVPGIDRLDPTVRELIANALSTILLLALAAAALLHGAGRLARGWERTFWRLLGAALACWMLGEATSLFIADPASASWGVAVDALYLAYYLLFAVAIDVQAWAGDQPLLTRRLRILASIGRVLFVGGFFAYFVVLPVALGTAEYLSAVPSFSFYIILDAYLAIRLAAAFGRAQDRRWRAAIVALAAASLLVVVTDSLDLAWIADRLPDSLPRAADLLWYLPMVILTATCRWRVTAPALTAVEPPSEERERVRGVPLLVYSLGFAVSHLAIDLVQPRSGSLHQAQILLVVATLVVFAILNLIQNGAIDRLVDEQELRRQEAEDRIRALSLRDPLTGLLNRRALETELARAMARAERTGLMLALMFIDLDDFKIVNDSYGHSAGDGVLREAAARLKVCTREVDTLARYGGDEFILVLEALDRCGDVDVVGARILEAFGFGFQHESRRIELSASIGVALHPIDGEAPAQLIEAADRAMYRAKLAGGGRFVFAAERTFG
ncbi:MAG: GGDEF domain-containing protein [Thermoanaerobaculales bacterium]|nr:GGDEF domain-containing protein [Thermoanaerobaculales bacterium]